MNSLFQISLLVKDYDEAIRFYTEILGFELIEDTKLSETKRWVRIQPKGSKGASLLLAKAKDDQVPFIGNQTGGRVFLFVHTENLAIDHERLLKNGVKIVREPSEETFGKVLVFKDLYGNLIDLIQPS